jgi:hypothetical protein
MPRWIFIHVFAFFCLHGGIYSYAHAAQDAANPYSTLVTVDEMAGNAIEAKERGLHQAEMKGLFAVLNTISPDRAKDIFDTFSAKDVHQMVESVRIENEREKAQRYQADVYITFSKLRVDAALDKEKGIVSEKELNATGDGTVLVLPVFNDGNGNLTLWQPNNAWRDALNTNALEHGKNKVIMPFGDPTDTLWLDQETVLGGDIKVLQKAAERYGTRNVVIALATVQRAGKTANDTRYTVTVTLGRAGKTQQHAPNKDYMTDAGIPLSTTLDQAAVETITMLADTANQFAIFEESDAAKTKALVVRVEYTTPDKWLAARTFIDTINGVKLVDIGAVTPHYAQATIYFKGSADSIKHALQSQHMIVKDTDGYTTVIIP